MNTAAPYVVDEGAALKLTLERVLDSIESRLRRDKREQVLIAAALTRVRCGESAALVRARLAEQGIAL